MPPLFSKEQKAEIVSSIQRYLAENLDSDLSEMQAGFLLEYFMSEIAPFAYNEGVEDARKYFTRATENLPGTCFREPLTHWKHQKGAGRVVSRKPDR
ncbi:MAG TPA: DUF2164 domain-containing protein [Verrucomicrobiales bacterium]|nr:DUF2164 domain-containing protein [Verrucomicrobiales bacterium]